MTRELDFVEKVVLFNSIAEIKEEFSAKNVSLYTGLVLEEAAEMIAALNIDDELVKRLVYDMNYLSSQFKKNKYAAEIMNSIDPVSFLDGAVDTAVVSVGAAISIGADANGSCHEVMDSNLSKFPVVDGKHVVMKDENGKIMKPATYRKPELGGFLK